MFLAEEERFSRRAIVSVICTGVMAGVIASLQPLLLGELVASRSISTSQLGQAAMLECLGMAASAILAATFLKPERLRPIIACAAALAICGNLATPFLSGNAVLVARTVAGLCSGLMLWLVVGLLTRVPLPARILAIYVTVQAAVGFLLASSFTFLIIPMFSATGSYFALAALNGVVVLLASQLPRHYRYTIVRSISSVPPMRGLLGLLGVSLHFAGILAFWVYIEPVTRDAGYRLNDVRTAISLGLGSQILAGVLASILAARLRAGPTIVTGAILSIACIVAMTGLPHAPLLLGGVIAFAAVWMFIPAFQMPFLIEIDPSRRSAMHIASAQLLGAAFGPLAASMGSTAFGMQAVGWISASMFASSAACIVGAKWGRI